MVTFLGFMLVIADAVIINGKHTKKDEGIFCGCLVFAMFVAPCLDFFLFAN